MYWIILVIAGLFETLFAICLGKANEASGTAAAFWYTGFVVCLAISMLLLMKVTQHISIGVAYSVWTGIGAAGTVIAGILIFNEPTGFWRMFFLSTLIISIVGLRMVSRGG